MRDKMNNKTSSKSNYNIDNKIIINSTITISSDNKPVSKIVSEKSVNESGNNSNTDTYALTDYYEYLYNTEPEFLLDVAREVANYCRVQSKSYNNELPEKLQDHNPTHCVHGVAAPMVYSQQQYDKFISFSDNFYRILTNITRAYIEQPRVREFFHFDKDLEELIIADRGYECLLPMMRLDVFFNTDTNDLSFCEINTDGTSAMNENDTLNRSLCINKAYLRHLSTSGYTYQQFDSFKLWITTLVDIYQEYLENTISDRKLVPNHKPYIAIVDFLDKAYLADFVAFRTHFQEEGYETEICDITELKYDGNHLISPTGHIIDVVYRRAVTSDIIASCDKCQPLINAYKDGNVCLVGSFASQVVHNKKLFALLWQEEITTLLSDMGYVDDNDLRLIRRHVPYTVELTHVDELNIIRTSHLTQDKTQVKTQDKTQDKIQVKAQVKTQDKIQEKSQDIIQDNLYTYIIKNKDKWIIKPLDSYNANGIIAGVNESEESWCEKLTSCIKYGSYIAQHYVKQATITNYQAVDSQLLRRQYNLMPGLYMYGGSMAAIYSRTSPNAVIGGSSGCNEVVSLVGPITDHK